jgi:hypothetical protein
LKNIFIRKNRKISRKPRIISARRGWKIFLFEETERYPENAELHQPEGAGRYLSEKAETYFSEIAETYFSEETGGRILINFLVIR